MLGECFLKGTNNNTIFPKNAEKISPGIEAKKQPHRPPTNSMRFESRREGEDRLALQGAQGFVQFDQIRVKPIKPGLPLAVCFFGSKSQNSEVGSAGFRIRETGKAFPKKRHRKLAHYCLALAYGKNGPQHPLIFRVRLAEVEIRHRLLSSAEKSKT